MRLKVNLFLVAGGGPTMRTWRILHISLTFLGVKTEVLCFPCSQQMRQKQGRSIDLGIWGGLLVQKHVFV